MCSTWSRCKANGLTEPKTGLNEEIRCNFNPIRGVFNDSACDYFLYFFFFRFLSLHSYIVWVFSSSSSPVRASGSELPIGVHQVRSKIKEHECWYRWIYDEYHLLSTYRLILSNLTHTAYEYWPCTVYTINTEPEFGPPKRLARANYARSIMLWRWRASSDA